MTNQKVIKRRKRAQSRMMVEEHRKHEVEAVQWRRRAPLVTVEWVSLRCTRSVAGLWSCYCPVRILVSRRTVVGERFYRWMVVRVQRKRWCHGGVAVTLVELTMATACLRLDWWMEFGRSERFFWCHDFLWKGLERENENEVGFLVGKIKKIKGFWEFYLKNMFATIFHKKPSKFYHLVVLFSLQKWHFKSFRLHSQIKHSHGSHIPHLILYNCFWSPLSQP